MRASRLTAIGILALIAFRLWFAAVLPMTGDEAYFVVWGENPAGGYYDHPPMVGWWLSALLAVAHAPWWLRLPALVVPLLVAVAAWWLVRPYGAQRARLAALLVLLQPVNVWNVAITTDTPVIVFSTLSLLAYVAALRAADRAGRAWLCYAVAGVLLGLAFLGKYFAALLGFAYFVHSVLLRGDRRRWAGLTLLTLGALPAVVYNLWWNSGHCWDNVLFNFINRNEGAGFSLANPALYLVSLAYLATPWLLYALWRHWRAVAAAVKDDASGCGAVFWLAAVPLLVFAALSLARPVGLHWIVSFIALPAVLAAIVLPVAKLERLLRGSALFAVLHVALVIVIVALPLHTWKKSRLYDGIVFTVHTDELLEQLQRHAGDAPLATDGYSSAATLAFTARRPVAVFGEGSLHGRQDDTLTDWRALDGRRLAIVRKGSLDSASYAPYFSALELREIEVRGARFQLLIGQGFKYSVYHDAVMERVRQRFYRIPDWLPQRGCEFCDRYFPDRDDSSD